MWIRIFYRKWNGKSCGHYTFIRKKSQLQELAERYEIQPQDIISFESNGKVYDLEEVRTWITEF